MQRLGDFYTDVQPQDLNEIKEAAEIYYYIEFHDKTMREVNFFKLWKILSDKCSQKVKELTTHSKTWFSFKVEKIEELNLLTEIKKV